MISSQKSVNAIISHKKTLAVPSIIVSDLMHLHVNLQFNPARTNMAGKFLIWNLKPNLITNGLKITQLNVVRHHTSTTLWR